MPFMTLSFVKRFSPFSIIYKKLGKKSGWLVSYRGENILCAGRLQFLICTFLICGDLLYQNFSLSYMKISYVEEVVAQWCNPLSLQPEQSGGVDSIPGRALPFECRDKGSWTRLGLSYFCDLSACC